MKKIPNKERLAIVDLLESKGMFFRKFWGISDIFWTDVVPTAAVTSHNGRVQFLFNRKFWDALSEQGRLFVVCHEQLHILNNHFIRLRFQDGNSQLKNIAADVAINEMLVRNYAFEKTDLPNWENYCWLETIFPPEEYALRNVSNNETAEYYYSILLAKQEKQQAELARKIRDGEITIEDAEGAAGEAGEGQQTLDDHIFSESQQDNMSEELRDAIEEALEEVEKKNPTNKEVNQAAKRLAYRKAKKAGKQVGDRASTYDLPIKKKRHWKKLYKNICKSIDDQRASGHWAFQDNKMALLNTGLDLPGDYIQDERVKTKVLVYLDVSGSCVDDTKFFLTHAMSLPTDLFEVNYYTFDTEINSISSKPPYKITGGGGTCFACIRDHVETESSGYDAVFVFTDGEAPKVDAKMPYKWFWFITPSGTHNAITNGSRSFDLNDYGWDEARYGKK